MTRAVGSLTIGQQQMLQIASAIGQGARLIVFDEPTSSLSQHEAERLYSIIGRLRERGVTCIYVSHRLEEIFLLCDTITVLRDGRHVATRPGRRGRQAGARRDDDRPPARGLLSVARAGGARRGAPAGRCGCRAPPASTDVSFALRAGEVLGFAGLVGAGRSEVASRALRPGPRSRLARSGCAASRLRSSSAAHAIALGIGLVPEDRKRQGLVLSMDVLNNATLSILPTLARLGFITRGGERQVAQPYFERLRVKSPRLDTLVAALSGGNQQKIVLTKWLAARCPILILDEPTRGVDVGAKAEIHALIDELAAAGNAIILISSEMPEVLNLSTRILVFRAGRVVGELSRAEATRRR